MNEYDQNNLWNGETEQPEENREPQQSGEPEAAFATESHAETEPHAGTDAASEPELDAAIEREPQRQTQPEAPAEPSYQNYFYSSGPMRTARPAQADECAGGSAYTAPQYGTPNYGASGYGTPNYGGPYYGTPNYAAQNYNPAQHSVTPPQQTKQHAGGFWKKAVALALTCTLLGGGAGVGGALLVNKAQEKSSGANTTAVQVAAPRETKDLSVVSVDSGKLLSAADVYKQNVNSTVGITTEITTTNFWGYQSSGAAAGSGFILTEDGYILTNEHVIEDANSITVAMYDGTTYPATLIGYDASNDIAVLKIDAHDLTPVTLGDSDALEVGDEVIAIGNPLGELTFSLTKGNVSALNRAVTLSNSLTMNLIQTDAAINSGNSGGALFNMYGEVVGITNAKYSSSSYSSSASIDNIGFAIPINSVRNIVSSIIEKGYISTPYLGVSVGNVSEESQSYGMPEGAAIRSVEKDSPAEKAGLQANDIVTAIDGETVTGYEDLKKHIVEADVGGEMVLTVYRKGETLTITVTVGEKTQSALPETNNSQSSSGYGGYGGQNGGGSWGWGFPSPENP